MFPSHDHLLKCIPPEPTDRDWVDICDESTSLAARNYRLLMDKIADMQEQADDIKKTLIQKAQGANRVRFGDLKMQKILRQGSVDYSKIEAIRGIDLTPYRKDPIISWRFS